MSFEFHYLWVGIGGALIWMGCFLICATQRSPLTYRSGLATLYMRMHPASSWRWDHRFLWLVRSAVLLLLLIATARPRMAEERSEVRVEGIGIMLALDVSNSMLCFDDIRYPKISRFVAAQEEAQKFVARRPQDLFGLVFFGRIAATRCPLTMDHRLVTELLRDAKIGALPHDGTALAQAIIMAVRRLQSSKAKSNIIVLLTDGEPSPDDIPLLGDAIACAQKAGVKIYTIGIGSASGGYIFDPQGAIVRVDSMLNRELLTVLAQKTGGAPFEASNQQELNAIYKTIDTLEKTESREPRYANWQEWYWPFAVSALCLLCLELCIAVWRGYAWISS